LKRNVDESTGISELSGQAEVDEMYIHGGTTPKKDIFRFDIAMNNVSRVDELQMRKLVSKQENKYNINE
jgi:hypothetical protein